MYITSRKRIIVITISLLLIFSQVVGCQIAYSTESTMAHDSRQFAPPRPNLDMQSIDENTIKWDKGNSVHRAAVQEGPLKESIAPKHLAPVAGSIQKVLVIPIQFQDVSFNISHNEVYFQQMMTGPTNSMKDYFEKNSGYQNGISGISINAVVSPIVTSAYNMTYYGADITEIDTNGTQYINEMAREAVQLLESQGFDFSGFDTNSDNIIDHLFIIHAGNGQENTRVTNDIWSHRWDISNGEQIGNTSLYAFNYATVPETGTLGVFCHEFAHDLGLPDLYDTDGATNGNTEGAGRWDIMASGSWNGPDNDGTCPANLSAWSKYYLGWLTPNNVSSETTLFLTNNDGNNNVAYKIWTDANINGNEYYLVEYRRKLSYDSYLPGEGILIWHIDKEVVDALISMNKVNAFSGRLGVELEQADGDWDLWVPRNRGDDGDPFPGSSSNRNFNAVPFYLNYSNIDTNSFSYVDICNITTSGITASADYYFRIRTPLAAPTLIDPLQSRSTLDLRPIFTWNIVPQSTAYRLQISENSSFTVNDVDLVLDSLADGILYDGSKLSYSLSILESLDADKNYYWRVAAINPSGNGPWSVSSSFRTPPPVIFTNTLIGTTVQGGNDTIGITFSNTVTPEDGVWSANEFSAITSSGTAIGLTGAAFSYVGSTLTITLDENYAHLINGNRVNATPALNAIKDIGNNYVQNTEVAGTTPITGDITPPTVALSHSNAGLLVKSGQTVRIVATFNESMTTVPAISINLTGTDVDIVNHAMTTSGSSFYYDWTVPDGHEGSAVATVAGKDHAGNVYSGSTNITFTIDNTPPVLVNAVRNNSTQITVTLSENCTNLSAPNNGGFTVTKTGTATTYEVASISSSTPNTVVLTVANTDSAGRTGLTITYTAGGNGNVQDTVGNVMVNNNTGVVIGAFDLVAPSAPVISTAAQYTSASAIEIPGTTEPYSIISIIGGASAVTGSALGNGAYNVSVSLTENTANTLSVTATDAAGNISAASSVVITHDSIAPTASVAYSDADGIVKNGDSLTITVTFSEDLALSPIPNIAINNASTISAIAMSRVDARHYTYTFSVGAGDGLAEVSLSVGLDLAGNPITATPVSGRTFNVDNTAPANVMGYPNSGTITESTVQINARINEAGRIYIVCVPDGAVSPSALQIKNGFNAAGESLPANLKWDAAAVADTEVQLQVKGLRGDMDFDIYVVAVDTVGNIQAMLEKVDVHTLVDSTEPVNASTFPQKGTETYNSATVLVKTDEYGKAYYVVLPDNAATPSAIQVKNGQNASGAAVTSGNISIAGGSENTITITGLSPSTHYDVYVVAEDVSDNLQADAVKIDINTSAAPVYNDPTPPAVFFPPAQPPVQAGTISIPPVVSSNGSALAEVSADAITKAFDEVTPGTDGTKTVTIKIPNAPGAKEFVAELPAAALSSGDANRKVEIETPAGTLTVPGNMFTTGQTRSAKEVSVSIEAVDTTGMSEELKKQIGSRPVVELNARIDNRVVAWKNNDAPVTVSIKYTPTEEEKKNPEHIVVYYIDGQGKVHKVPNGRYDPATGLVTFTTTHFSKYAVAFETKTFDDIADSRVKKQIEVLASKGVFGGVSATSFGPTTEIRRADFIVMLIRALGISTSFETNFDDVKPTDYYYEAVGIAKKLGITGGVGNNKFNPRASITRQDMMVMVAKALAVVRKTELSKNILKLKGYGDYSKVVNYAKFSIATLINEGFYTEPGTSINPKANATREQVAELLYNIYSKK